MTILKPRNPAAKENAANGEVSPSAVSQNLTRCTRLSPVSPPPHPPSRRLAGDGALEVDSLHLRWPLGSEAWLRAQRSSTEGI
jgi:hypothetical protein